MIETLLGSITSVGFESGHRFVIGSWAESPIGPFADVMWAAPDGHRALVATPEAAEFVTSVYPFDDLRPEPVAVEQEARRFTVVAGPLRLTLSLGRLAVPFPPRPRWITATVENWCSQRIMGVQTYGISPTGVTEWYQARSLRWITAATGSIDGQDLGFLAPVNRPLNFGFTDPPRHPSHVKLHVTLHHPD